MRRSPWTFFQLDVSGDLKFSEQLLKIRLIPLRIPFRPELGGFLRGQIVLFDAGLFRHEPDLAPHLLRNLVGITFAEPGNVAPVGKNDFQNHMNERAFARTVFPDQSDDVSFRQLQVDRADQLLPHFFSTPFISMAVCSIMTHLPSRPDDIFMQNSQKQPLQLFLFVFHGHADVHRRTQRLLYRFAPEGLPFRIADLGDKRSGALLRSQQPFAFQVLIHPADGNDAAVQTSSKFPDGRQ